MAISKKRYDVKDFNQNQTVKSLREGIKSNLAIAQDGVNKIKDLASMFKDLLSAIKNFDIGDLLDDLLNDVLEFLGLDDLFDFLEDLGILPEKFSNFLSEILESLGLGGILDDLNNNNNDSEKDILSMMLSIIKIEGIGTKEIVLSNHQGNLDDYLSESIKRIMGNRNTKRSVCNALVANYILRNYAKNKENPALILEELKRKKYPIDIGKIIYEVCRGVAGEGNILGLIDLSKNPNIHTIGNSGVNIGSLIHEHGKIPYDNIPNDYSELYQRLLDALDSINAGWSVDESYSNIDASEEYIQGLKKYATNIDVTAMRNRGINISYDGDLIIMSRNGTVYSIRNINSDMYKLLKSYATSEPVYVPTVAEIQAQGDIGVDMNELQKLYVVYGSIYGNPMKKNKFNIKRDRGTEYESVEVMLANELRSI